MKTVTSIIPKIHVQQLLHWIFNVESAMSHKNYTTHNMRTVLVLKLRGSQINLIASTVGGTGNRTGSTHLLTNEWSYDKECRTSTLHSYFAK